VKTNIQKKEVGLILLVMVLVLSFAYMVFSSYFLYDMLANPIGVQSYMRTDINLALINVIISLCGFGLFVFIFIKFTKSFRKNSK
jgi:uncharacterized protein with PQ loop repeat